jgi:ketosteroid isomerase-like protein
MRSIKSLALVGACCLASACASPINVNEELQKLLALDREWSQTTASMSKSLDMFMSYYAADASVYPPGMTIANGTAAIRAALLPMTGLPGFALQWSPTKANMSASGDLGYTAGSYALTMNDANGRPVIERGKYVEVWKKQSDGTWKVIEDIFNADTPPASASATK